MEVYRLAKEPRSKSLTSSGTASRWNLDGEQVIYTGYSRSLATLELLVRLHGIKPSTPYKIMNISVADEDDLISQVLIKDLPANWRSLSAYSKLQAIGSDWYRNDKSLVLKVPSAVVPAEHNYLINTKHPLFASKVNLVRTENYFWDDRLF